MKSILVIEDEPDLLEAIETKLVSEGYDVHTSQTSEAGLRLVIEQKPDLILLDVMTNSLHGAVFADRLRQLPEGKNDSKLIILSNLDNNITKEKFPYNISDYLIKSEISLDTLVQKITAVLSR